MENCNSFELAKMHLFSNLDATHCVFVTFSDKLHCLNKKTHGRQNGVVRLGPGPQYESVHGGRIRKVLGSLGGKMWGGLWLEEVQYGEV